MKSCCSMVFISLIFAAYASAQSTASLTASRTVVADGMNWSAIPTTTLTLFHPGQASEEWLHSAEHPGRAAVKSGIPCLHCHQGHETFIGNRMAQGGKLEPSPIPGKQGTLPLHLQIAYDPNFLYLRASWPSDEAGRYHEHLRYTEGQWKKYGNYRAHPKVRSGAQPPVYEDRFSIAIFGPGPTLQRIANGGCWAMCHSDLRFMPHHPDKKAVSAHPVLGKNGLRRRDVRKYLALTRTSVNATGGWRHVKPEAERTELRRQGNFVDLMQWRAHRSNPVGMADDGLVDVYRQFDAGGRIFDTNWDKQTQAPKYMFDPRANQGHPALRESDLKNPQSPYFLGDNNKVRYDPTHAWQEGDLLLRRYLSADVAGSAGDNNRVTGMHANGAWTVTWRRRLNTGHPDDVALRPGQRYTVGFAVHDDHTTARWHYVSFPLSLTLGSGASHLNASTEP